MQCIFNKDVFSQHMSLLFWHLSCLSFLGSRTVFPIIFFWILFIIVLFSFFSPCLLSIPFLWTGVQSMPWKSIVSLWGELIISFSWICSLMFFLTSYSYFNYSTHAIFKCKCCFTTVIVSFQKKQWKNTLIQNTDQKF